MSAVLVPLGGAVLAALVQHGFYAWLYRRVVRGPRPERARQDLTFVRRFALGFVAKIFLSVALVIGYALGGLPNPTAFMLAYAGVFAGLAIVESVVRTRRQAGAAPRADDSRASSPQ